MNCYTHIDFENWKMKLIRDNATEQSFCSERKKTASLKRSVMYSGCLQQSWNFERPKKPVISKFIIRTLKVVFSASMWVSFVKHFFFVVVYIFPSGHLQLLILATAWRECGLCENGPFFSSSEHRPHSRGKSSPSFYFRNLRLLVYCPWKLSGKLYSKYWWLSRSGWSVLSSRWPPKALPTFIRADIFGQTPNAEYARKALWRTG